jgi:hypothetical protein
MISEKRLVESFNRSAVLVAVSAARTGTHTMTSASGKETQRMFLA